MPCRGKKWEDKGVWLWDFPGGAAGLLALLPHSPPARCPTAPGPALPAVGARPRPSHSAALGEDIKDRRDVLFVLFGP